AGIQRFCASELILSALNLFGNLDEEIAPLGRRNAGPDSRFEGFAGGEDRLFRILFATFGYFCHDLTVGRADDGARCSRDGVNPFTVDEMLSVSHFKYSLS